MEMVETKVETSEMGADQFIPSAGIIVVEREKISERTAAGILKGRELLEEQKKELSSKMFCKVVAVPKDCEDIKVGDLVLPGRGITELPLKANEGMDIAWLRILDVIGIIKNEA